MFDKSAKSRIISEKKVRCGPVRKVSHSDPEWKNLIWKLCEIYLEFKSASLIMPNCELVWNISLIKSLCFHFQVRKPSQFLDLLTMQRLQNQGSTYKIYVQIACELIQRLWCLRLLACVNFSSGQQNEAKNCKLNEKRVQKDSDDSWSRK